tara:strand:- start:491 stop:1108 length:618 start_codon:yes stop_codon:yes gene_type:complete
MSLYAENMVESPGDRLRKARVAARFGYAAEAARRFGWPYSTYAAHENGQNSLSIENAETYSRAFKVPASWLLTGEGTTAKVSVPLRGYVGAGFVIMSLNDPELEHVDTPMGITIPVEAVQVKGNSMVPAFYEGDLIFYAPETDLRPPGELLGRECIIRLPTGQMYVKRLQKGTRPDRFLLVSYNSNPIVDAEIEWACPIKFVQRA